MKKHLSFAMMLAAASMVCAAVTEPKTLYDIQSAAYAPEKIKSVQSAKLIYEVKTAEGYALFVIRAAAGDRVRLDFISPKEINSAGRSGDKFWLYNAKEGFLSVPKRDREDVLYDLAFMPLPFRQTNVFGALQPDGEGLYGNDALKCKCYKAGMTEFPKRIAELWTDAKTGKLVLVKSKCAEGNFATSFLQYQDFDGIQLATRINLAGPESSIRMKLLSADWNLSLPESLFQKSEPNKDNTLILLQKTLAASTDAAKTAVKPAVKPAVVKPAQNQAKKEAAAKARLLRQIEKQEKLIRDLNIRIAEKERKLKQLEMVFKSDREQAAGAVDSAARSSNYRRSWNYYGWSSGSGSNSGARGARRAAKGLYKESVEIANEYDKVSRELTDLQIKLADAKVVLEKLQTAAR